MADKPKVKPSSAGVWIGLVMMLLSFASCGAGCVLAGSEIKDAADAAQRVDVPASQTYDMEADAAGIIIGLAPSASDAKDIEVSLTDENGTAVEVSTSSSFSSSTTESKGDSVEVLGTFEVKKAGTYTLNATGPAGTRVAILNISIGAILGKFFGGIGIGFFIWEQRKENDNEEEEAYQLLSDAYNDFLKVVLANSDLHLRTAEALPDPTPEQAERMMVIFDMLISLFERAYLVAYRTRMRKTEARRWNSWDDYMHEWCRRDDFLNALPLLLRGEDPGFQAYIRKVADAERAARAQQPH